MHGLRVAGAAFAVALVVLNSGEARLLHVIGSPPAPKIYLVGPNAQYVVRFDGPVDHRTSVLFLRRDSSVVETLPPSHDRETNVLAAAAPRPPAGD